MGGFTGILSGKTLGTEAAGRWGRRIFRWPFHALGLLGALFLLWAAPTSEFPPPEGIQAPVILALVGMAYVHTIWEAFLSTRSLERSGRLQALSLSQTRDGVTVIIERAYADASRIMIGYRIQGLPASSGSSWLPLLTLEDPDGHPIPGLIEEGLVGASELTGLSLPSGEIAGAASFDPWGLPGWLAHRPTVLSLRLRVAFYPVPSEDIFDLTIPVEPEAEEYGPQTISAQGLDLTLERWIWAPSGARAQICFVPPDLRLNWTIRVEQAFETRDEASLETPSGEIPSGQAVTVPRRS